MTKKMELEGTIRRWNDEKAYGFAVTPEGDVFVLASTLPRGAKVSVGTKVMVTTIDSPRGLRSVLTTLR